MNNNIAEGIILPKQSTHGLGFLFHIISFFEFVVTVCYYVSLGMGIHESQPCLPHHNRDYSLSSRDKHRRAQTYCKRVIQCVVVVVFVSTGTIFCRRLVRRASTETELWSSLIGYAGYGIAVEAVLWVLRRCAKARVRRLCDDEDASLPRRSSSSLRFFFFVLMLGSLSVQESRSMRSRYRRYEYLGPMRLTKLPSTHKMNRIYEDDLLSKWPCLRKKRSSSSPPLYLEPIEQDWIEVTIEVGWGKKWGCRDRVDKWNTNWPAWRPCSSLICSSTTNDTYVDNDADACSSFCHITEAEARNASWQCVEEAFDLSRLTTASSPSTTKEGEKRPLFNEDTPPWEEDDDGWPTVVRYGSCDGNVGLSSEVAFVDEQIALADVMWRFGTACLASCALAFVGRAWWNRRSTTTTA